MKVIIDAVSELIHTFKFNDYLKVMIVKWCSLLLRQLLQQIFLVHMGSLLTLLGGCTFASTNYLLSCEDLDAHHHKTNRRKCSIHRILWVSLVLGRVNICCHLALERKGGCGQRRWRGELCLGCPGLGTAWATLLFSTKAHRERSVSNPCHIWSTFFTEPYLVVH